ncbi:MAG: DUF3576 domain-containing protein [Alphaproteobacteria bacterium]|nr:DUF3576 domain-containing protein [Alphaproteobacteria bacterium]
MMGCGRILLAGAVAALVAGCNAVPVEAVYPDTRGPKSGAGRTLTEGGNIFGPSGLTMLGGKKDEDAARGGAGIGVNSFLWRASLDTIAFMPLTSADPFGGVIITDWFTPPETPNERFKATVYITDRRLRADAIKVSVFRQVRAGGSQWEDAAIRESTAVDLENAILARARELRIGMLPSG